MRWENICATGQAFKNGTVRAPVPHLSVMSGPHFRAMRERQEPSGRRLFRVGASRSSSCIPLDRQKATPQIDEKLSRGSTKSYQAVDSFSHSPHIVSHAEKPRGFTTVRSVGRNVCFSCEVRSGCGKRKCRMGRSARFFVTRADGLRLGILEADVLMTGRYTKSCLPVYGFASSRHLASDPDETIWFATVCPGHATSELGN